MKRAAVFPVVAAGLAALATLSAAAVTSAPSTLGRGDASFTDGNGESKVTTASITRYTNADGSHSLRCDCSPGVPDTSVVSCKG